MMAVVGDIVPKFKDFASQLAEEKLPESPPPPVEEIPPPEPLPTIDVPEELPDVLTEPEVTPVQEEVPEVLPEPEPEVVPEEVPVLTATDEKTRIEEVTAETLEYLEMLGNEVFDQSPVSVYFDDWLVNLRQVMLGFQSNDVIKVDDLFTDECEQIYNDIEAELADRLLKEEEIEASSQTLSQKKYILREMDDEYAAQSENLQVRGKSALDFLIRNVQRLEDEIAKTHDVQSLNFIRRIAMRQKRYTLTQKLKDAKHRLSLVMETSAAKKQKGEGVDTKSADFTVDRNSSKDDLVEGVRRLEKELAELRESKTSFLQPLKKLAHEQKISAVTQRLNDTKELLELAAQNSAVEQQRIREEYEKKKQAELEKLQNLEKDIATKRTDGSIAARKEAIQALSNAVKALIQRNAEPPQNQD